MKLSEHQQRFASHVGDLIKHINATGHTCTLGDAFRDPRAHGVMGKVMRYGNGKQSYSIANSNHKRRLAIDLNLFYDGVYLADTEHHEDFGAYWEALDPLNRWGGRYEDGNHYERVPEGWR